MKKNYFIYIRCVQIIFVVKFFHGRNNYMSFTGDFDIFVCLRENEEEAYTFPFTSPLHFFLIRLPFFSKKTEKKRLF